MSMPMGLRKEYAIASVQSADVGSLLATASLRRIDRARRASQDSASPPHVLLPRLQSRHKVCEQGLTCPHHSSTLRALLFDLTSDHAFHSSVHSRSMTRLHFYALAAALLAPVFAQDAQICQPVVTAASGSCQQPYGGIEQWAVADNPCQG